MVHYLIVRRDLPFGVTLAQVAHAAADSMEDWICSEKYVLIGDRNFEPMTVVVLGVRNELSLRARERKLKRLKIPYVGVREPDEPWNGELMSIGVWPGERDQLEPIFKNLQAFRFEDWSGERHMRLEDVR